MVDDVGRRREGRPRRADGVALAVHDDDSLTARTESREDGRLVLVPSPGELLHLRVVLVGFHRVGALQGEPVHPRRVG